MTSRAVVSGRCLVTNHYCPTTNLPYRSLQGATVDEQPQPQPQQDKVSLLQQALLDERAANKKLEEQKQALIEEFSNAETYEDQLKVAKEAIADLLPLAITTMTQIIASGENEGTRASLSKYVMESVLSGKLDKDTDGAVATLLKQLQENTTDTEAAASDTPAS